MFGVVVRCYEVSGEPRKRQYKNITKNSWQTLGPASAVPPVDDIFAMKKWMESALNIAVYINPG